MKWFTNVKTIEELKAEYKKLALKWHPDICGDDVAMKQINCEYDQMFERLKDIHETASGETYTAKESTSETPEQFREIINKLIHLDGIQIELIGSWIWITGDTYTYKETLKELHFRYSRSKRAWYFHTESYKKVGRKVYSLNEIRDLYGSETIQTEPTLKLKIV